MSMMGSPRSVAPTPSPEVALATVTVRLVVELEVTLTLEAARGTTAPSAVAKLSPGCTGFCRQKPVATLVTRSLRVVGGRISSPNIERGTPEAKPPPNWLLRRTMLPAVLLG